MWALPWLAGRWGQQHRGHHTSMHTSCGRPQGGRSWGPKGTGSSSGAGHRAPGHGPRRPGQRLSSVALSHSGRNTGRVTSFRSPVSFKGLSHMLTAHPDPLSHFAVVTVHKASRVWEKSTYDTRTRVSDQSLQGEGKRNSPTKGTQRVHVCVQMCASTCVNVRACTHTCAHVHVCV